MDERFAHLLSPVRIRNHFLKNRMIFPNACPHFLQGPEEYPADSFIAQYAAFARAGAALLEMAAWDNYPAQRVANPAMPDFPHMPAFDMNNPAVHNYISALAEEIHFCGSKILLAADPKLPGPSPFEQGEVGPPKATPGQESSEVIAQAKEDFLAQATLYHDLGFDGVVTRMDHPLSRGAGHVKSVAERTAFAVDCLKELRRRNPDLIIAVTLHGEQPLGYYGGIRPGEGYEIEEMLELVRILDDSDAVDILTLRGKDAAVAHPLPYNFTKGSQKTLEYAREVKALNLKRLLVAVNGGFQDPVEIERYMDEGLLDLISMARAFIAEPEYEQKLKEGHAEDVTPCIWCNLCHGDFRPPWVSVCSVNPRLGLEHKLSRLLAPAKTKKKIAVIGGGPAGMNAALVSAKRGHDVTLFERTGYLGGQMLHAEYFSFKWSIRDYRNWLVSQLEKNRVRVLLNTEPSPEELSAKGFDAVLAATGAAFQLPDSIRGLRDGNGNALYPTCFDVLGKEAELGHRVIIVGGSETGVETAMYLAENGHDVTVLTRQVELAADASHLHYITMAYMTVDETGVTRLASAWEKYENLHGITEATTTEVRDQTVLYRDGDGREHSLEADSVVICGGTAPRIGEAMAYAGCAPEFYVIGDCNGARKLWRCGRDAFSRASLL